MRRVRESFDVALAAGPAFGYFAEPTKSVVLVKPDYMDEADEMFSDLEVEVTLSSGFLGSCIGDHGGVQDNIARKVQVWVDCLQCLDHPANAAKQRTLAPSIRLCPVSILTSSVLPWLRLALRKLTYLCAMLSVRCLPRP